MYTRGVPDLNKNTGRPINLFFCILDDYFMKLVERMRRVYKAVIRAKGGYFEESKIHIFGGVTR
jgi:hypothetical protein